MAVYANLTIDQGSDFSSTITVEDVNGNVTNLAGYTARGQVRRTYNSVTSYDLNAYIASTGAGQIGISISAAVTGTMKPGRYVYDVEMISSGGAVTRVVEGQIEVMPRVTQP